MTLPRSATALTPSPTATRRRRRRRREVAGAASRGLHGRQPGHLHRVRDRPPGGRPRPAAGVRRLLDSLSPTGSTRRCASRRRSTKTLIPVCSRGFLKAPGALGAGRPARLAAAVRPAPRKPTDRTGRRSTGEGKRVAGAGLPAPQGDGYSRERGHGHRPGPHSDDRPRTRAHNAGLPARLRGHRAGPGRADHDVSVGFSEREDETENVKRPIGETRLQVCSSAVLTAREEPQEPTDLRKWTLPYDPQRQELAATRLARVRTTSRRSGTRLATGIQ